MRRIKKFAAGGSTGRYQAKYDRKVADIDSDYEKMLKRGVDKRVADAKRAQRMADAKDDMAKWTKSDRTETRAAKKASERSLSETRRSVRRGEPAPVEKKAEAPKAEAPKSESKPVVQETPKAEAKKSYDDMSFSAAFRQAMKDKGKGETFTWKGKSYKLEMAGDRKPTSRGAPPAGGRSSSGSGRGTPSAGGRPSSDSSGSGRGTPPTPRNPLAQYEQEKARRAGTTGPGIAVTASRAQVEAAKADARKKAAAFLAKQEQAAKDAAIRRGQRPARFATPTDAQLDRVANQQGFKKGGKVKKYAKGGVVKKSINGIAKRGLTRGARKK